MPRPYPARRPDRSENSGPEGPLATIGRLTDAWIRKDPAGMAQQLADDITELGPAFSKPLVGKRDFFRNYKTYFSSSSRIQSYRILKPCVHRLTQQLVLVHFRYRMQTIDSSSIEKSRGQESMLVELKRGRWFVKFIHWHKTIAE